MNYRPKKLPLKTLKWDAFADVLGKAHALLGPPQKRKPNPLTFSLLLKMHKKIIQDSKEAGKFRKKQNWIGPEGCSQEEGYFFPPSHKSVPKHMKNLKHYINSSAKDPLVQLAIFFAQLLIIHPFTDGNGRLARALVPVILFNKGVIARKKFDMTGYFKKHRLKYFEKLFQISEADDWEEWIRFFLEGIIHTKKRA